MTPKEKAKELIWKFSDNVQFDLKEVSFNGYTSEVVGYNLSFETKKYALIAVDEIIANIPYGFYSGIRPNYKGTDLEYWQEVKQEIEAL